MLAVVRVCRPKFVRKDRLRMAETSVSVAPPPELPLERGLAGPGLLADTIVRRWQDHLPLYRLEQIYARDGLELLEENAMGDKQKKMKLKLSKRSLSKLVSGGKAKPHPNKNKLHRWSADPNQSCRETCTCPTFLNCDTWPYCN